MTVMRGDWAFRDEIWMIPQLFLTKFVLKIPDYTLNFLWNGEGGNIHIVISKYDEEIRSPMSK